MRAFAALLSLEVRSAFGWKPLVEYRSLGDWLKLAGAGILGLFLVADVGFVLVLSDLSQFRALEPRGLQDLLLLNAAILASITVFFLGFIMMLSGYSLSPAESRLFSLPLRDGELLAAKFAVVLLSQAVFSLFIFGASLVVFGVQEGPPAAFWLVGFLVALALPFPPLALAWLVVVPLMSLARFMRNKSAVLAVSAFVGLAFALAFNFYTQNSFAMLTDPIRALGGFVGPGTVVNQAGSTWPPSWMAWKSLAVTMAGQWPLGLGLALGLLALGAALSFLVVAALGRIWRRSVISFGEGRLRKLAAGGSELFIASRFGRHGAFRALFLREWRFMNREPRFFLNGPFIIVLMPAILAAGYFVQRGNLARLRFLFEGPGGPRNAFLAAAAFGAFLGSSTSVASTALSRDAKSLAAVLALPVSPIAFMAAKLVHALVWALIGALVGAVAIGLLAGLAPGTTVAALFVAAAFSALANLVGLWIDTARPRLAWDNPTAALKQNPNSALVVLGSIVALVLGGWLAIAFGLGIGALAAVLGGGSSLLFIAGLAIYARFAIIKIREIEPRG